MNATASTAAQGLVTLFPILGIVAGATIAFFYPLWNHRRKVRLIEQGIAPRTEVDLDGFALLTRLLAATGGAALVAFYRRNLTDRNKNAFRSDGFVYLTAIID